MTGAEDVGNDKRLIVLGVGNLLMRDEGVGIHVLRRLERGGVPEGVSLIEAGVATLDIVGDLEGCDRVLVIDATDGGGEPGAIYRYNLEELEAEEFRNRCLAGAHQICLAEAVQMGRLAATLPEEITVIGIQPASLGYGADLSPEMEAKMDTIMDVVRREIARMLEKTGGGG